MWRMQSSWHKRVMLPRYSYTPGFIPGSFAAISMQLRACYNLPYLLGVHQPLVSLCWTPKRAAVCAACRPIDAQAFQFSHCPGSVRTAASGGGILKSCMSADINMCAAGGCTARQGIAWDCQA